MNLLCGDPIVLTHTTATTPTAPAVGSTGRVREITEGSSVLVAWDGGHLSWVLPVLGDRIRLA